MWVLSRVGHSSIGLGSDGRTQAGVHGANHAPQKRYAGGKGGAICSVRGHIQRFWRGEDTKSTNRFGN